MDVAVASVRTEPVDVGALVRDAVAARSASRRRRRRRRGEATARRSTAIPCASGRSLDNLIANARRARGLGGRRRCAHRGRSRWCSHRRSPTPDRASRPTQQERIFDARRAPRRRRRRARGSGSPLARAIAEAHGGSLDRRVGSRRGTTFTLALPLSAQPRHAPQLVGAEPRSVRASCSLISKRRARRREVDVVAVVTRTGRPAATLVDLDVAACRRDDDVRRGDGLDPRECHRLAASQSCSRGRVADRVSRPSSSRPYALPAPRVIGLALCRLASHA